MSFTLNIAHAGRMLLASAALTLSLAADHATAHAEDAHPVLLVGGTTVEASWLDGPKTFLASKGYKVYTIGLAHNLVPLGFAGSAPIEDSAAAIAKKVDEIRTESCQNRPLPCTVKVDIIGHSQGALAARYYTKFLDVGQVKTGTMVSLGGVNWGDESGILFAPIYPACAQMLTGSSFLTKLNSGDPTPGAAHYYHLYSKSANYEARRELEGADNVAPQDICGKDYVVKHEDEWSNPVMRQLIVLALQGKSDPQFNTNTVTCP